MIITGGKYRGRKIIAPDENITRPTLSKVRMGVFNTLYSMLGDFNGLSFLDVFGGSGIMGLEALSRGFKKVLVFEKNPSVAGIIKRNYQTLGLSANLNIGDSLKLIDKIDEHYDVVYIDPPYQSDMYNIILDKMYNKAKIIVAEHSKYNIESNYAPIKSKNYGGKIVSYYSNIL